jgi:hypothetical protein
MRTEDFYAEALLAALPVAIENNLHHDNKPEAIKYAHDYAALLTETFTRNRHTYQDYQDS